MTLRLQQAALPAPSSILSTIATSNESIHVLNEEGQLVSSFQFRDAFPHSNEDERGKAISSISVDSTTSRIVATLKNKLAVFEPIVSTTTEQENPFQGGWRVHSSFTSHYGEINAVDHDRGMIVLQSGQQVIVYTLREDYALPSWKQVSIVPFSLLISHLRLYPTRSTSTSSRILALLPLKSSTCLIYDLIVPSSSFSSSTTQEYELVMRSKVVHSVRLKGIEWRPATDSSDSTASDSGPILMTTTIENTLDLWGCVIDEPKEFSLWISLPHSPPTPQPVVNGGIKKGPGVGGVGGRSPLVPLDQNKRSTTLQNLRNSGATTTLGTKRKRLRTVWSGYWKTRSSSLKEGGGEEGKKGNEDLFWSVFEDGQVYLTVVSNLDSRPPTCLTSRTLLISSSSSSSTSPSRPPIPLDHLSHFRSTCLIRSRSHPETTVHLLSLSSWSSLLHTELSLNSSLSSSSSSTTSTSTSTQLYTIDRIKSRKPPVSFVGHVRKIVRSFPTGENCLVLGSSSSTRGGKGNGTFGARLQSWEVILEGEGSMGSREESVMDLEEGEEEEEEFGKKRVASWFGGRRIVVGRGNTLRVYETGGEGTGGGKKVLAQEEFRHEIDFDLAKAFFVVRRSEDDLQTWVIAVTKVRREGTGVSTGSRKEGEDGEEDEEGKRIQEEGKKHDYTLNSWIYHSPSRRIFPGAPSLPISTSSTCSESASIVWVSIVPPPPLTKNVLDRIKVQSVDSEGCVRTWGLGLDEDELRWEASRGFETGVKRVRRSSSRGKGVIALATDEELSIWNENNSRFGNALEFSLRLEEKTISLEFSIDLNLLALATPTKVLLFTPTRRSSTQRRWTQIATISPSTPSPITNLQFHANGIAIACQEQLFFHSFDLLRHKIDKRGNRCEITRSLEAQVEESSGPLGIASCDLLTSLLQFGHFATVQKFFSLLADELDEDGKVRNRIDSTSETTAEVFGVSELLQDFERDRRRRVGEKAGEDAVMTLSSNAERSLRLKANSEVSKNLTGLDRSKLVAAFTQGDVLRRLSRKEHTALAVLVRTVFDVQGKVTSVDENGIRYLTAVRSLVNADPSNLSLVTSKAASKLLDSRDILFAYHSTNQQVLVDESVEAVGAGGKLSWENAKSLGIPLWLRDRDALLRTMELVGRTSFLLNPDERDPILPMLFYLALRRLPTVYTFWKQSLGHGDQRQMLKFLGNDFDTERWKSAARKNAFALLSKRRFLFAAAFFLLGDSLSDCVSVILRHLSDPMLAIAIARTYEETVAGEAGPVLRELVERTLLPKALREGDRFLSSWAFETLEERELSVRVLIDSLPLLAKTRLKEYKLESPVSNPPIEDPTRIVLLQGLLQNAREVTVNRKTEFEFVLYIARQLRESGCHFVALDLVRSYKFALPCLPIESKGDPKIIPPSLSLPEPKKAKVEPTNFVEPDTSSLFDMLGGPPTSTLKPLKANASSTASAMDKTEEKEAEEKEEERQKRLFREASGTSKPRVETKSTVEAFSFDAFGF
ncbi:hypothetical protein JCM16303_006492 [Sporobolomyces ruberrimus]